MSLNFIYLKKFSILIIDERRLYFTGDNMIIYLNTSFFINLKIILEFKNSRIYQN
ncbi:hypothetical protein pb186bvf_016941 [Paramecium bursaria]